MLLGRLVPLFFVTFSIISFSSCTKEKKIALKKAYYYWKSNNRYLSPEETNALVEDKINKVYIKFFEVAPDKKLGIKPIAKSQLRYSNLQYDFSDLSEKVQDSIKQEIANIEIVPTIYLQNDALKKLKKNAEIDELADNINFLIKKRYNEYITAKAFTEIQIDCDWTPSTKATYFKFLTKIKQLSKKKITVTLRLYPYKFPEKMGVPPVDRVTLMSYNLSHPLSDKENNTIQNNKELKKYLEGAKKYPLPIDIALPIYSWIQWYQYGKFKGLIQKGQVEKENLKYIKPMWYQLKKDTVIDNNYLRVGDQLKIEEVSEKTTFESIALLKKYIDLEEGFTLTLFHLDNQNINKYTYETRSHFFTAFAD